MSRTKLSNRPSVVDKEQRRNSSKTERGKNRKHITTTLVQKLKPADRPFEIRDTELEGFLIRVQPSGVMTFYFDFERSRDPVTGKRRRSRIRIGSAGMFPDDARKIARKKLVDHDTSGNDPTEQKELEKGLKLRAKASNYLNFVTNDYKPYLEAHLRGGINNEESVRETMANLVGTWNEDGKRKTEGRFSELHTLSLKEITPLVIDKWKQRRLNVDKVAASTANRQMNDLRACLSKAVEWGMIDVNPFDKVKSFDTDSSPKVRHLSPAEEMRLRNALNARESEMKADRNRANEWRTKRKMPVYPTYGVDEFADHLKPAVLLSLNTGLRRGELLKLKWKNVDLPQRNLTVEAETAKAGKTRHVRLNDEAISILRTWREQSRREGVIRSVYVFCDSQGQPFSDMRTSWEGLLKAAKIENFRWHDLRHTFASNLVIAGVDLNKVRALLGHSDYKMTLRYAHLAPDHMQDAVDRLVPANRLSEQ